MFLIQKRSVPKLLGASVLVVLMAVLPSTIVASGTESNPARSSIIRDGDTVYLSASQPARSALSTASANRRGFVGSLNDIVIIPDFYMTNIIEGINLILRIVVVVAALLVFFYLIWGALSWITSGGDKGQTDKARQRMIAAIVGLVILSATYALYLFVLQFFGIGSIEELLQLARTNEL